MHIDFTIRRYIDLLEALLEKGFCFFGVHKFYLYRSGKFQELHQKITDGNERIIVLRQDLDLLPLNSLAFARIQNEMGILSTFYIRSVSASFNPDVIKKIAGLGHEIGYHYEDVSFVAEGLRAGKQKGLEEKEVVDESIKSFERNLERLRKLVPVKSICMHGSPWSKWDSRLLWKYYDYREFKIEVEPYFDLDIENMLYLTDTGRRWNGSSISVRDKAGVGKFQHPGPFEGWKVKPVQGSLMNITEKSLKFQNRYNFGSTSELIQATEGNKLPDMMMTFHPQRWTDKPMPWFRELVWQNIKNVVKYLLIKFGW